MTTYKSTLNLSDLSRFSFKNFEKTQVLETVSERLTGSTAWWFHAHAWSPAFKGRSPEKNCSVRMRSACF